LVYLRRPICTVSFLCNEWLSRSRSTIEVFSFFIFKVLFFGENLTQDDRDIFRYEVAASFPSRLATFELVSMVSRYSLWDGSEKLQLTRICINLCGRHGCPAQSGNTWLSPRKEDKTRAQGLEHDSNINTIFFHSKYRKSNKLIYINRNVIINY